MRITWKGWTRTRRWNESFPEVLTTYLLAQIRAASRASDESCSYSLETRWQQKGCRGVGGQRGGGDRTRLCQLTKSSTEAFLRPRSKMLYSREWSGQLAAPAVANRQQLPLSLRVQEKRPAVLMPSGSPNLGVGHTTVVARLLNSGEVSQRSSSGMTKGRRGRTLGKGLFLQYL